MLNVLNNTLTSFSFFLDRSYLVVSDRDDFSIPSLLLTRLINFRFFFSVPYDVEVCNTCTPENFNVISSFSFYDILSILI